MFLLYMGMAEKGGGDGGVEEEGNLHSLDT